MNMAAIDQDPSMCSVLEQLCAFHKAGADQQRLSILRVLCSGSFGVLELADIIQIKQTALSHHLKVLTHAEIVTTRRDGNSLFYCLSIPPGSHVLHHSVNTLIAALRGEPLPTEHREAIERIKARRAVRSEAFFEKNASKFDQFQEQVAVHHQYSDVAISLLKPLASDAFVIEFGPGHGAFLPWLSVHAAQVVAIDKSEAMLAECEARLKREKINNVCLQLGDTQTARRALAGKPRPDAIVANMVLHHVAEPAEFIEDIAHLLKDNGIVVVTELRQHEQAWTKELCGDIWQGFTTHDISEWSKSAGLDMEECTYRGLRNGFEVMGVRLRKPKNYGDDRN